MKLYRVIPKFMQGILFDAGVFIERLLGKEIDELSPFVSKMHNYVREMEVITADIRIQSQIEIAGYVSKVMILRARANIINAEAREYLAWLRDSRLRALCEPLCEEINRLNSELYRVTPFGESDLSFPEDEQEEMSINDDGEMDDYTATMVKEKVKRYASRYL